MKDGVETIDRQWNQDSETRQNSTHESPRETARLPVETSCSTTRNVDHGNGASSKPINSIDSEYPSNRAAVYTSIYSTV